mgnify:CR=1 FL=1
MKLRPCENQSQLPLSQAAVDHLDLLDPDSRAPISVPGMEVRAAMVVVVHRDRDPEKAADSRHVLDVDDGAGRTHIRRTERAPAPAARSRLVRRKNELGDLRAYRARSKSGCCPPIRALEGSGP